MFCADLFKPISKTLFVCVRVCVHVCMRVRMCVWLLLDVARMLPFTCSSHRMAALSALLHKGAQCCPNKPLVIGMYNHTRTLMHTHTHTSTPSSVGLSPGLCKVTAVNNLVPALLTADSEHGLCAPLLAHYLYILFHSHSLFVPLLCSSFVAPSFLVLGFLCLHALFSGVIKYLLDAGSSICLH